jgi:hypothetical protein
VTGNSFPDFSSDNGKRLIPRLLRKSAKELRVTDLMGIYGMV